jgi:23S rRNA pseudouridine1911/1915/1917 synthase
LDRWLVGALARELGDEAPSRAEVARWIEAGAVHVDGAAKRAKDVVRAGVTVQVAPRAPSRATLAPDARVAFDVLHVDDDLVVLVKPAGLVVHPAAGNEEGTLVHGLLARGWFRDDELTAGDDPAAHARPGIVHRLDKGTSGVMVVARTAFAREGLKALFATHDIERAYDALVVGVAEPRTHRTLHGRHPTDRKRFTTKVARGRHAVTHVAVVEALVGATLVRCTLETGRTHQIRVHLAESGTPVLGDPLYGRAPRDPLLRALGEELGHQALHARVLGFVHPRTKKKLRFEAPPPADFARALAALRVSAPSRAAPEERPLRGRRRSPRGS